MAVVVMAAAFVSLPCRAIDYQPFDYYPLPLGTSALEGYYEYGKHDAYNNTLTGLSTKNTKLNSDIGVIRFIHYDEDLIFGHEWDFNFLVPFGSLRNGEINGTRLDNASGVSDPVISDGIWLINQPKDARFLSVADYVTVPIGTYDRHRALNLGGKRWQNDLQMDLMQGLGDRWMLDFSVDWLHSWDNTEAGTGNQRLAQAASYGAYIWLSYDVTIPVSRLLPHSSSSEVSLGYAGTFGGAQKIDNQVTGAKTDEQQIRLTFQMFVIPSWQTLVFVSHDVHVQGQFNQNFGMGLRLVKVF